MANITTTTNDNGSPLLKEGVFQNDVYTAAGAVDLAAGTILARNVSTGKLVDYVIGGTAAVNGTPSAIVTQAVEVSGAGDVQIRPAIGGQFQLERLVVVADGDASNIDAVEKDKLRLYNLTAISVNQMAQATP